MSKDTGILNSKDNAGKRRKNYLQIWSHDLLYEMVPSVLQPLTPLAVQAGDTAVLTCRICGRPRPDIKWTFQGNSSIQPGQRFQINSNEDGFVSLTVFYTFAIYLRYICAVYNLLATAVLVRLTITLLKHRHFVKLKI